MPSSIKLLQNLLDYCSVKNNVIAKNISNIGTENYKREDVVFKDILNENVSSFLKTTDAKHISALQINNTDDSKFEHVFDNSTEMDSGVNNVNIEREMTELAENTLRFKFASRKVGDYFRDIQSVIKGGGAV
ncbi:MAG: flagellar basal body rod protein FlgB [Ignavibacteriales bacterium]|nr:flagellar basal body rod protein FlgB [Ignavibacteriales bacterium]